MKKNITMIVFILSLATTLFAEVKPHVLFTEGAVLQREIAIPVWGTADPGEKISVELNGQSLATVADGSGNWIVKLKPVKAGGPYVLKINSQEIKNILIGDVWICSGQSNMEWRLKQTSNPDADVAGANYPMIRLFQVPRSEVDAEKSSVNSSWKECTSENAANFSAIGYFFGRDLHKNLKVPIGLINNAVGGSPAESWMSNAVLKGDSEYKQFHEAYPKQIENHQKALERHKEVVAKAKAEGTKAPNAPGKPWMPSGLYNGMLTPLAPYAIKGAIWYQGESNAGRAYQYRRSGRKCGPRRFAVQPV